MFSRRAGASGALILALEAAECGRRAKTCLDASFYGTPKVSAIINARSTGEKPCFDGFGDVQPKSLGPNEPYWDMLRQKEEIRVREKSGGFMLVVAEVSTAHRSFKGMCSALVIPWRNCRTSASSVDFRGQ